MNSLQKQLWLLILLRITTTLSSFLIFFLALYLKRVLGFELGFISFSVTVSAACYVFGSLASSYFVTKLSNKTIIVIAVGIALLLLLAIYLAQSADKYSIIALISVYFFFIGMSYPAINSSMVSCFSKQHAIKAAGIITILQNGSYVVLYFCGGILLHALNAYVLLPFILMAFLALLFACFLYLLSDQSIVNVNRRDKHQSRENSHWWQVLNKMLIFIFILYLLFSILDSPRLFLLPNWLHMLAENNSARLFGYISALNCIIAVLITPVVIRINRHRHIFTHFTFALLLYGVAYIIYGFTTCLPVIIVTIVIWTWGETISSVYFNAFIARQEPATIRTQLYAAVPVLLTLGRVIGVPFVTVALKYRGYSSAWLSLAFIAFAGIFMIYVLRSKFTRA